jgi:hypothetical protein
MAATNARSRHESGERIDDRKTASGRATIIMNSTTSGPRQPSSVRSSGSSVAESSR